MSDSYPADSYEHPADIDARNAFAQALRSVKPVTKNQTADTGKYTYKYADLGDILAECQRACGEHGLSIAQVPTVVDGHLAVRMWLLHEGGGQVMFDPLMMVLPKEAQPYGSALTYARRYQLMTVFGIAPDDDDGRAATVAAQTQPGRRSEAERLIREAIVGMDDATRAAFVIAFKAEFHTGLSDLPVPRHGAALTWTREWINSRPQPDGASVDAAADEADRLWVDQASGSEAP